MRRFTALIAAALVLSAWWVWQADDAGPGSPLLFPSAQVARGMDEGAESGRSIGPTSPPTRTAAVGIACVVKHLPSGAPASGAVRLGTAAFPLVDGRCRVPPDALAHLDQEPPLLAPHPLSGPLGDAQTPLPLRVVQATPSRVELCAPDGWFFTATVTGTDLAHARVWMGAATHAADATRPADAMSAASGSAPSVDGHDDETAEDLTVDPRSFRPAELVGDRLAPVWVDAADAFVLAVVGPGGVHQETVARPTSPIGHLKDLGTISIPAAPGLRITIRRATGDNPREDRDPRDGDVTFKLDYARMPEPSSPSFDAALALRHANPELADFVLDASLLEISERRPLLLVPLPSDPRAQLTLIAPSGLRAPPVQVELRTGSVTDVVLDLAELFPVGAAGVSLRGAVRWQHDGTPIRSGRVELSRTSRSVSLDQEGRFSLGDVPAGSRAALRLVGFDPQAPDRIERLRVDVLATSATDQEIRWEVAPSSVIHVRGLRVGTPPLAFALQRYDEDRGFVSTTLESAVPTSDGVDIRAKAGDVYRVIACWSGVFQQMTGPVELSSNGADATTVFDPLLAARFLTGQFVDRSGAPIPNATVEVTGSIGALPPIVVQADGSGRFSVGPVNAPEVSLIAYTETAHGEITVAEGDLDQVEIVAD